MLGEKFDEALKIASELHREQTRKATPIPYLAHLMAVAGLRGASESLEVRFDAAAMFKVLSTAPVVDGKNIRHRKRVRQNL